MRAPAAAPMPILAGDLPRLDRAARVRFSQGVSALTERIAQRAAQLGRPEPEALARSVVAELVGALSLARAEPDAARSNAMLADSREQVKARLGISARKVRIHEHGQGARQRSHGIEQLRALMQAGKRPGIGDSLDFTLVEVNDGMAAFVGTPGQHAYNPIGMVHGGYAATLLDSACGVRRSHAAQRHAGLYHARAQSRVSQGRHRQDG